MIAAGSAGRVYDAIGRGYSSARRPDPGLSALLWERLAGSSTVLNVGAGTGNYEEVALHCIAAEPSSVMLAQRPVGSAPAVQATAEVLPFDGASFDAAMAISTIHHWTDLRAGLGEMRRVAGRRLVYFSEPARLGGMWLVDDYFPEIVDMPINRSAPSADDVRAELGGDTTIDIVEVTAGFTDCAGAFWSRPERYCDPQVRSSLSMFALLDPGLVEDRIALLEDDLASGAWDERHGHLRDAASIDLGYRLVTSVERDF